MGPHTAHTKRRIRSGTRDPPSLKMLSGPPVSPQLLVRPWWFPVQELSDPLVFYIEASLSDIIFGPNQSFIPEIEWLRQVLLRVDTVDSGNLLEITIYGRPCAKNLMKNILLTMVAWHKEHSVQRATKMKQLEEFLKNHPPAPNHKNKRVQETLAD